MSEKDLPRYFHVIVNIFAIGFVTLVLNADSIFGTPSLVEIASKSQFSSGCEDLLGNSKNHLDVWYEGCSKKVCYSNALEVLKFKVHYDCPPKLDLFDSVNCQYSEDLSLTYPDCCPQLSCATGSPINDTRPACRDMNPTATCELWKNMTNCVDSVDTQLAHLYNITVAFCQLTCGYCTPIG